MNSPTSGEFPGSLHLHYIDLEQCCDLIDAMVANLACPSLNHPPGRFWNAQRSGSLNLCQARLLPQLGECSRRQGGDTQISYRETKHFRYEHERRRAG